MLLTETVRIRRREAGTTEAVMISSLMNVGTKMNVHRLINPDVVR